MLHSGSLEATATATAIAQSYSCALQYQTLSFSCLDK